MIKSRLFRSFRLRAGLKLLAWEAAVLALAWLLRHQVSNLQRFYFSDCLFVLGTLLVMVASVGMMGRPYGENNSPWGIFTLPVQTSEQEKRYQMLAEFVQQRSFALHLASIGLLTILIGLGIWYLSR